MHLMQVEACEKSSWWLWKEKLCLYWCERARKYMCVTDRHDMTLAVKVALNPSTANQPYAGLPPSDLVIAKYTPYCTSYNS